MLVIEQQLACAAAACNGCPSPGEVAALDPPSPEHEQQHDDVDAEIHDAAQHPLPQMRDHPHERRDIPLLPKVVSRLFVDQRCDVFERLDDRLGLEGDVLHLVDDHPDDQTDRHQETEHRLAQQQRRGQAAPPVLIYQRIDGASLCPHLRQQYRADPG